MAHPSFQELIQAFESALKKKEKGSFTKDDVKQIYEKSRPAFDQHINDVDLIKIRDKFVALAEGRIDKNSALKKLQGTSRPEAIQSVLLNCI